MYSMLTEYGGRMRPDDEVVYQDLQDAVKAFNAAFERATGFVADHREKHAASILSEASCLLDSAQVDPLCGASNCELASRFAVPQSDLVYDSGPATR
jgi:hypothetical protein